MSGPGRVRQMTFNETFQSSLVERNQEKFTVDKSLIKGIKQNDVAKIVDQSEEREIGDEKQLFDEEGETHVVLVDARKRYDEVKTQSSKAEQEIQKLKAKRETLKTDEDKLKALHDERRKEMQDVQNLLQEVTETMNNAMYRKDIYLNLKGTTKSDILVLKKRYFDKDVRLMRDKTKLKSLRSQATNKVQLSKRCQQMLSSMERTVTDKTVERTSKLNSVHVVLNKKHYNQMRKEERQKQIQQAMVSAMTDKLPEEKQWNKMYSANLLLKGLLKHKMQRLLQAHYKTQIAFHRMKQQTSMKDAGDLVERFLNKQQYYGQLLESISEKQHKLELVKEERQKIEKMFQETIYENQQINEGKEKIEGVSEHEFSIIENLHKQLLLIDREKQLIYQWATKFLAAYQNKKSRDQITHQFKRNQIKQIFTEVLKTMKSFMSEVEQTENSESKFEAAFMEKGGKQTLSDMATQKNTRIKTLSTYEDASNDMFEDKDMIYDDLSEIDYLQYNRRAIKKNDMQNRKFRIKTKPY